MTFLLKVRLDCQKHINAVGLYEESYPNNTLATRPMDTSVRSRWGICKLFPEGEEMTTVCDFVTQKKNFHDMFSRFDTL